MPIAPKNPYMKWTCKGCGWSTVIKQTSDCIMRPVTSCPNCHESEFTFRSGSAVDAVNTELTRIIPK